MIYVFGGSGYIGSAILKELKKLELSAYSVGRSPSDNINLDLNNLDLSSLKNIKKGDICIFLSAISSPEYCNKNYENAFKVNVKSTSTIITSLLDEGAILLFASSDVIYGKTENPVDEESNINPCFEYAEMKAIIEDKFIHYQNFYVMRLSYVWSLKDKFSKFLLASFAENSKVKIFDPFIRSIISINDLILFVTKFCSQYNKIPKIINLAGPDFLSRKQLVEEYSKRLELNYEIVKPDDDFFKYRPDKILMISKYLPKILSRDPIAIRDEINKLNLLDHV